VTENWEGTAGLIVEKKNRAASVVTELMAEKKKRKLTEMKTTQWEEMELKTVVLLVPLRFGGMGDLRTLSEGGHLEYPLSLLQREPSRILG
jgi:hypothetical protein